MDLKISKIFTEGLLFGKSKHTKAGNIEFDSIRIGTDFPGRIRIEFYLQGTLLASATTDTLISPFSTSTLKLEYGNMQMAAKDESSTGTRERIKTAVTEIQEALNEEKEI